MLPPFDPVTGYLPPGPHVATWAAFTERFGWNEWRRTLLAGLALVTWFFLLAGSPLPKQ